MRATSSGVASIVGMRVCSPAAIVGLAGGRRIIKKKHTGMLELLETFCAVVDAGSLNKAAEHLSLGQPAITRQLRTLERLLGAVLLIRSSRGVRLTPAGAAVLPHAREAAAAVRACRRAAAEASAHGTARLSVASGLMAMQYVLPPAVARFHALYPAVELDLQPAHQQVAVERLLGY